MKCTLISGLILLSIGAALAGPATRPATVTDAQRHLTDVTAAVISALDASAGGKPLVARVAQRQQELDDARAGTDPQAKLDASAAFNRARGELDAARKDAVRASPAVAAAQNELFQAKAEEERAKKDAAAADAAKKAEASKPRTMTELRQEQNRAKGLTLTARVDGRIREIEARLKAAKADSFDDEQKLALAKLQAIQTELTHGGTAVAGSAFDHGPVMSQQEMDDMRAWPVDIQEAQAYVQQSTSAGLANEGHEKK